MCRGFLGHVRLSFRAQRKLLVRVEGGLVAFDPGLKLGELAVGGALGAAGHLAAGDELHESLAHPQRFGGVAAAFVDGGQPFVRVAAHEPFGDALLEKGDGPPGVAALENALGLLVALNRDLEVAEGIFLGPDPLPLLLVESIERRRPACAPIRASEHALQAPENQSLLSRYAYTSISKLASTSARGQS